jgi:hypothetical protein
VLDIETQKVTGVLLSDGWHPVDAATFTVTLASRYVSGEGPAQDGPEGMATWSHEGERIYCPLASVLALRERTAPAARSGSAP